MAGVLLRSLTGLPQTPFSGEFAKHFMLQVKETSVVVNDKEKRKHDFCS
jgi:hypothetical protein